MLLPQLDRATIRERLSKTTSPFRADPRLLKAAERNWYVLTGDPLPPAETAVQ